jgi:hypothetical protein
MNNRARAHAHTRTRTNTNNGHTYIYTYIMDRPKGVSMVGSGAYGSVLPTGFVKSSSSGRRCMSSTFLPMSSTSVLVCSSSRQFTSSALCVCVCMYMCVCVFGKREAKIQKPSSHLSCVPRPICPIDSTPGGITTSATCPCLPPPPFPCIPPATGARA